MKSSKLGDSPTLATSTVEDQTGNFWSLSNELLTPYALHVKKPFVSLVKPRSLSYSAATARNWDPMLTSSSATDILIGPEVPCVV
jgi:hypothetical protein